MLQITSKHKVFMAVQPIDFRFGIDAIAALCLRLYQLDPKSGHFFLFKNGKGNAIKILAYDSQGFWLCHKRLSSGRFQYWPKSKEEVLTLTAAQLHVLLYNGDPQSLQSNEWPDLSCCWVLPTYTVTGCLTKSLRRASRENCVLDGRLNAHRSSVFLAYKKLRACIPCQFDQGRTRIL